MIEYTKAVRELYHDEDQNNPRGLKGSRDQFVLRSTKGPRDQTGGQPPKGSRDQKANWLAKGSRNQIGARVPKGSRDQFGNQLPKGSRDQFARRQAKGSRDQRGGHPPKGSRQVMSPPLLRTSKRGQRRHPLYKTWAGMIHRCYRKANPNYQYYGGRGIKVCQRWHNFSLFIEDIQKLGPRPEGYTLDRIDNGGWYKPDNVRWASKREQQYNRGSYIGASRFKGVSRGGRGWRAYIRINGKQTWLGSFAREEEAAEAYRVAAAKRDEQ